jgi:hypothetical protein
MTSPLLTIDVAHPPRHPDVVEEELLCAWSQVRNSSTLRVLKIIHGHGSTGKGGSTRNVVRNWVFRNRSKFRLVIEGSEYSFFDVNTQNMRLDVGQYSDADLETPNPGITVVWVR